MACKEMCYVLFDKELEACGRNIERLCALLSDDAVDKYSFISWLSRHVGQEDYGWLRQLFTTETMTAQIFNDKRRLAEAVAAVEAEDVARLLYLLHRETDGDKMQKLVSHKCAQCSSDGGDV